MNDLSCTTDSPPALTSAGGIPLADNAHSLTAGPRGPLLVQDWPLFEKHAHFNRERIPERVVHAKGYGAFGTFTVTRDLSEFTKAALFARVGQQTQMFARFSIVAGELGAADAERDVRGFALKFYTEQGNWDLVGNNTPVFFVRDAYKFSDFAYNSYSSANADRFLGYMAAMLAAGGSMSSHAFISKIPIVHADPAAATARIVEQLNAGHAGAQHRGVRCHRGGTPAVGPAAPVELLSRLRTSVLLLTLNS